MSRGLSPSLSLSTCKLHSGIACLSLIYSLFRSSSHIFFPSLRSRLASLSRVQPGARSNLQISLTIPTNCPAVFHLSRHLSSAQLLACFPRGKQKDSRRLTCQLSPDDAEMDDDGVRSIQRVIEQIRLFPRNQQPLLRFHFICPGRVICLRHRTSKTDIGRIENKRRAAPTIFQFYEPRLLRGRITLRPSRYINSSVSTTPRKIQSNRNE